jgi:UDP-N-acetylmuramyl pentapeptide synthase
LLVESTRHGLRDLAEAARARFQGKVIALTGTVGKTSSREMLIHALDKQGRAVGTRANNNNILGVCRTLSYVPREYGFSVLEMGFGNPLNGLSISSTIARPHVALFTALSAAHFDVFPAEQLRAQGGLRLLADHKSQIFDGLAEDGVAVIQRDIEEFEIVRQRARERTSRVWTYGESTDCEARLLECGPRGECTTIRADVRGTRVEYKIRAPGRHMAMNCVGVLLASAAAGADVERAARSLESFEAVRGRARIGKIPVIGGLATLIDDSFNATPASVRSSLELLQAVAASETGRRIAVLRDILHLGPDERHIHRELAEMVVRAKVDKVFTCGELMKHLHEVMPEANRGPHTKDLAELYDALTDYLRPGDVVTIKSGMGHGGLGDQGFLKLGRALREGRNLFREQQDAQGDGGARGPS